MRFLHTSDWHLGRIFYGRHLTDDQAYVLDQLIHLAAETKPDAIILAGDVYDRAVPPTEAVQLLDEILSRLLLDYSIPVLIIAGNHDSPDRLGFGNRLLARQGLHVIGPLPERFEPIVLQDQYGPVFFAPLTYAEPALVRERLGDPEVFDFEQAMQVMVHQALDKIPSPARKVAIAHAFIAGGQESDSERPLSVGGSSMVSAQVFASFEYTALGHLHNSQRAGGDNIRYSGSLMKYSFAEANQRKGVNLVEMDAHGQVRVETFSLSPRREVRRLDGLFKDIARGPRTGENPEDYLMITLRDNVPILDIRGQLQNIYPNVMHIEYPRLMTEGNLSGPTADHRRLTEKELFNSFFEQMTGEKLTGEQSVAFSRVVEDFYRQEREGKA